MSLNNKWLSQLGSFSRMLEAIKDLYEFERLAEELESGELDD